MSSLFTTFEERPKQCSAVLVGPDNADQLANYYVSSGYDEATVRRYPENGHMVISLRLLYKDQEILVPANNSKVLIYGHPPTVADHDEFSRAWVDKNVQAKVAIAWAVEQMPAELREKWEAELREEAKDP